MKLKKGQCKCVRGRGGMRKLCRKRNGRVQFAKGKCRRGKRRRR